MAEYEQNRQLIRQAIEWWDADRSRLVAIKTLAYGLFLGSIAGTIYAGVKGALPLWAVTIYVFFAVELVFLTFMYAIKHSGQEEIRSSIFELRLSRLPQWDFERAMLFEFARIAACQSAGIDPHKPDPRPRRGRAVHKKAPLPSVDGTVAVRELVRAAVLAAWGESENEDEIVETIPPVAGFTPATTGPVDHERLELNFVAYSSETFIELSREIADEIDDLLSGTDRSFDAEIHVRVLVRDTSPSHQWLVPLAAKEREDSEYGSQLRTRFDNVQRSALKEFEDTLKNLVPPRQVTFAVRGYRMEPLLKGVMVNGTRGIIGFYSVSELRDPEGWDYSGHGVDFAKAVVGGNPFENAAAEFFNEWFELIWDERYSRSIVR